MPDGLTDPEFDREPQFPQQAGSVGFVQTVAGDLRAALRDPVVVILFVAGLFDGISDNWVHACFLWGVAGLIGLDDARRRRGIAAPEVPLLSGEVTSSPIRVVSTRALAVTAALAYVAVGGEYGRYTWPATLVIIGPAVLVVAMSWRGPLRARPVPAPIQTPGVLAWLGLFVAAGLWELGALLAQPSLRTDSYAHPTLSYLMDPILSEHIGRSIVLGVWLGIGWWLLTRPGLEPAAESRKGVQ
jgi:hypothetical protein